MKDPQHALEAVVTLFATAKFTKAVGVTLGAIAGYFLPTEQLRGLALGTFLLIIVDTISGVFAARASGIKISSARFGRLLTKLVGYGIVIVVCTVVSKNLPGMAELSPAASSAALMVILVTEAISVTENLDRMGVPFPQFIRDALQDQRERHGKNDLPEEGKE